MKYYLLLLLMGVITSLLTAGLYYLENRTGYGKLGYRTRQAVTGILFGAMAVIGTEFGISVNGVAVANVRDAAPLLAGFVFGAPAGIIAGLIGGIERCFSTLVLGSASDFTMVACAVSTALAGFYAAVIRVWVCGNKRPSVIMGMLAGAIMEAFHLLMVFLTHLDELNWALYAVESLALPMMIMTAVSVGLGLLSVKLIRRLEEPGRGRMRRIADKMRRRLLIVFVSCFIFLTYLIVRIHMMSAEDDIYFNLMQGIDDLVDDTEEAVAGELKDAARVIASTLSRNRNRSLADLADNYNLSEICVVTSEGIVTASTNLQMIDYDLNDDDLYSRMFQMIRSSDEYLVYYNFGKTDDHEGIPMMYASYKMRSGSLILAGMDEEKLEETRRKAFGSLIVNRHIRNSGYFIISEQDGTISDGTPMLGGMSRLKEMGFPEGCWLDDSHEIQRGTILGEDSFYQSRKYEEFCIFTVVPRYEVLKSTKLIVYILVFIQMIIYALVYTVIYKVTEKTVVDPIRNVDKSLDKIIAGELDELVDERSSQEFDSLSNGINKTVGTLKEYISEAENRIEKELLLAKNIQMSALPSVFPPYPDSHGYEIYASMDPAKTVGGDFYDIFRQSGRRLVFMVADVSGKGIPAAMFMMTAKTMIKNLVESGRTPAEAFTEANNRLCEGNDAEMFVTSWLGVLDVRTGHVTFVNAGHNPPLVYKNGEGFTYLRSRPGLVLAGLPGIPYKNYEMDLQPGEKIFLYTDGAPEAVNPSMEQYGEQRLQDFMNSHSEDRPDVLIPELRADIEAFAGGAEQFDDITMLELVYTGVAGENQ